LLLPATIYREQFPLPYILPLSSILSSERLTCYFNTNTTRLVCKCYHLFTSRGLLLLWMAATVVDPARSVWWERYS